MLLPLLATLVLVLLGAGYLLYGSFIARQYRLDDGRQTPAVTRNDGIDFVPTRPFYLLGQHFSAIAAAGPIVGPILACAAFGWLPCILWIVIGVIFIGAVHDFSALVASVRHRAHSVAEIAREHLGRRAYLAIVAFIWLALVYVIVSFTDVTAAAFIGTSEELETLRGKVTFNLGGAVAAASAMYLLLAMVMGVVQRLLKPPTWLATLIFVPATLGVIYGATRISTILAVDAADIGVWYCAILGYCFLASLLPMWLLQQPRGYLGGFVLYLALAVGVIGIFFGRFEVRQPMVKDPGSFLRWLEGSESAPAITSLIFPFLFVTIACGACSGFHGLVCGGTTSKQIARESHCKPIAFGAMLMEGFVAIIALSTIMILAPDSPGASKAPGVIYGEGLASFLVVLLGDDALVFARTFGTMAVATFIFDTLDVATRLGRYLLGELHASLATRPGGREPPLEAVDQADEARLTPRSPAGRFFGILAAALTAGVPLVILLTTRAGSWKLFWTLFGTANQLLASLTLLGITVWLYRSGRRYWYTLLPMLFVMTITVAAILLQIGAGVRAILRPASGAGRGLDPAILNGTVAAALLALAVVFIAEAIRAVRGAA
jgi:carbon starvation protein